MDNDPMLRGESSTHGQSARGPAPAARLGLSAAPVKRRGTLTALLLRFFFFLGQILKVLFFTILVFAVAGVLSYLLVQKHIQGQEILVPNITGRKVDDAARVLKEQGLDLSIQIESFDFSDLVAEGEIVSQFPQPGNNVKSGTVLRVHVSRGTTLIPCPDVRGKNFLEAGIALRNADLDEGVKSFLHSPEYKKDAVIAQDPGANAPVERRIKVNLLVSLGPEVEGRIMPNLLDSTFTEAEEKLKPLGLRIASQTEAPSPGRDNGLIFEQDPSAGASVLPDDPITVRVVRNEGR